MMNLNDAPRIRFFRRLIRIDCPPNAAQVRHDSLVTSWRLITPTKHSEACRARASTRRRNAPAFWRRGEGAWWRAAPERRLRGL